MSEKASLIQRLDACSIPLSVIIRLFLGGYFIYTGVNKALAPFTFLKNIRLFEMLPETPPYFLNGTAVVLPWMEILCGIALVLGWWMRGAAASMVLMLCVFTPAIFIRAMTVHQTEGTPFFQIAFDCGCGTGAEIIWLKLCKNAGLLLLAILLLFSRCRRMTLAAWLGR